MVEYFTKPKQNKKTTNRPTKNKQPQNKQKNPQGTLVQKGPNSAIVFLRGSFMKLNSFLEVEPLCKLPLTAFTRKASNCTKPASES